MLAPTRIIATLRSRMQAWYIYILHVHFCDDSKALYEKSVQDLRKSKLKQLTLYAYFLGFAKHCHSEKWEVHGAPFMKIYKLFAHCYRVLATPNQAHHPASTPSATPNHDRAGRSATGFCGTTPRYKLWAHGRGKPTQVVTTTKLNENGRTV